MRSVESRRDFLTIAPLRFALLATTPSFLLACNSKDTLISVEGNFLEQTYKQPPTNSRVQAFPQRINIPYLENLLRSLEQPKGDRENRVKAVLENMYLVTTADGSGYANGLRIDQSGIYLTARHVAADQARRALVVQNPSSGELSAVTATILADNRDLALVFAPNNKAMKSVDNLQIKTLPLSDNEKVWLSGYGLQNDNRGRERLYRGVFAGNVSQAAGEEYLKQIPTGSYRELAVIIGSKPWGGSSGSPYINTEGLVVGIESGVYPNDRSLSPEEYKGSVIAPITDLITLASKTPNYFNP